MNNEKKPAKLEEEFVAPHINSRFAIIVISIFLAMLLLPSLAWGVLKLLNIANPAIMETLDFDTGENRAMATFPDSFDPQTFTAEVEAWYNDTLPFRSVLFKTQETMENKLEAPYVDTIRPALLEFFHPTDPNQTTPPDDVVIENPFEETTSIPEPTETETLPEFETEETTPTACEHVLSSESHVITEATCTEWGIIGYACENCDYVKKEYSKKSAHKYVSNVEQTPMCGTKYERTMTCNGCGDSYTETVIQKHEFGKKLAVNEPSYLDYGYTLVQCKICDTKYRTELSNKLYDNTYFPPIYRGKDAIEGRFQWMFYRGNDSERFYTGANLLSDQELIEYAQTLQTLDDICKTKGIQFQVSIWPNKEQLYPEFMPNMTIVTEYKKVERLVDYVTENTDVKIIYPLAELTQAKPYWELYWPLDTHWNNAGAFIGYQAMLKSLGFETTSMVNLPVRELYASDPDFKTIVPDGQASLLYAPKSDLLSIGGVNGANYPKQKNYIVTYRPEVKVLSQEGTNGASDTRHTTSDGPNDLNFVMLADSYRVMQLTYLEKDFTDCFLSHRDKVLDADVIEAVKNADVLVLAAVERLEPSILTTAKRLISILSAE